MRWQSLSSRSPPTPRAATPGRRPGRLVVAHQHLAARDRCGDAGGLLLQAQGMTYLADIDPDNPLTPLQAAACSYRIVLGPRAGQEVLSLRTVPGRDGKATAACAPKGRASACMPGGDAARISARNSNACAGTSRAPRSPTNGSSALPRMKSFCN